MRERRTLAAYRLLWRALRDCDACMSVTSSLAGTMWPPYGRTVRRLDRLQRELTELSGDLRAAFAEDHGADKDHAA